jgi:hypothetical protein
MSISSVQETFQIAAFRVRRAAFPLLPYGALDYRPVPDAAETQNLLDGHLCLSPEREDARWIAYSAHAWRELRLLLLMHRLTKERACLDKALAAAVNWILAHPITGNHLRATGAPVAEDFAWLGMAAGYRIYRLGYLVDAAAREPHVPDATIQILVASAQAHHHRLLKGADFRSHSNHGLHEALGLLSFAARFSDERLLVPQGSIEEAISRTRSMMRQQFLPDGGHSEHSPAYHARIHQVLENANSQGLIRGLNPEQLLCRSEIALSSLILPNGELAAFGDTDRDYLTSAIRDPETFRASILQNAVKGQPKAQEPRIGALPNTGYFFAHQQTSQGSCALIQSAAFHSRVHKHADHGGFIWFDRGQEILSDPGRFALAGRTAPGSALHKAGYWYSDPRRIYVESSAAHNTIVIDGKDHNRKARPFGSALRRWGVSNEVIFSECDFIHDRIVRWARVLAMIPSELFLIVDWVHDRTGQDHTVEQHFQFARGFDAHRFPNHVVGVAASGLAVSAIALLADQKLGTVRVGEEDGDGRLHGWISDQASSMVAAPSFTMSRPPSATQTIATLFGFGTEYESETCACATSISGKRFRLAWRKSGKLHRLQIDRSADAAIQITQS